jgi:hypothetical protein
MSHNLESYIAGSHAQMRASGESSAGDKDGMYRGLNSVFFQGDKGEGWGGHL